MSSENVNMEVEAGESVIITKVSNGANGQRENLLYLDPAEIVVDEEINVRRFSSEAGDTEEEVAAIQELAESMLSIGQEQPVRVRRGGDGAWHLVSGSRRQKAAQVINMTRAEGEGPFMLAAVASNDDVDNRLALQQAAHENLRRKAIPPMDMARLFEDVRAMYGWAGKSGTASVAAWAGVSTATVTQYEKLLKLGAEHQRLVHEGKLSVDAAIKLAGIKAEKRDEVLKKAEEETHQLASGVWTRDGAVSGSGHRLAGSAGSASVDVPSSKKKKARNTGKIQKKHLKDPDAPEKKTRKDVVEWMTVVRDSPAYGGVDGAVRMFAAYFVEKWVEGEGTDRTLDAKWDAMTKGADKGTAASTNTETASSAATVVVTAAKGRKIVRPVKPKSAASKKPAPKKTTTAKKK